MPYKDYDRKAAVGYAQMWAYKRNGRYFDFDGFGGDCTNFASQCLYAGSGVMNYTPVTGWYYINSYKRSPSWTGVAFFYKFLVTNNGAGPFARECKREDLQLADFVQLKRGGVYTHTLLITRIEPQYRFYIASHTYDSFDNPLDNYLYEDIRYLHIEKVRI